MSEELVLRLQFALAVAGLALLGWERWGGRKRPVALAVLGALGVFSFFNFGQGHFGNYIHAWDNYHYYLGAKYFPELGYTRIYECTAIADVEAGQLNVGMRRITDLQVNERVDATEIVAHPERCKEHFSAERWAAFKRDVAWFRARFSHERWLLLQQDHGYNATPVWNMVGHALTNTGPATATQVGLLDTLDPLLLLGMFALICWALGWRTAAIAALVFGTTYPCRFFWTGGSLLRYDWLFWTVASVCLLKKDRPLAAGAALGYAVLLRLFPVFLAVGPVLALAEGFWRTRRWDPRYLRFFAGGLLAAALLVPLSLASGGGLQDYRDFARNTAKHAATPLTNHMGLRTALSYRPSTIGTYLKDGSQEPWGLWKRTRLESFREARPLFALLVLGFTVALFFAVRGPAVQPWIAAALSAGMIAVGAELTCYYYAFLVVPALLSRARWEVGMVLLAFAGTSHFIGWAPMHWMSSWEDEQYTAMSIAALIAFCFILWRFAQERRSTTLSESSAHKNP